jgi:hypothetical protein
MPDIELLREFVRLDDEKKNGADAEKRAKARIAEIEPQILESFIADGVSSIKATLEARDVDAEARTAIIEWIDEGFADVADIADNIGDLVQVLRGAGLLIENRPEIKKTIFIGSRIWATPVAEGEKANDDEYEQACAALEAAGWGDYVQTRFNVISLSSAVKEAVDNGEIVIPDGERETTAFDGTVRVVEKLQLNARKAS